MDLRLYDTLSREKRVFAPLDPTNVRMYVCGPTVYDFAHIGNARPVIVFDVLFRLLRHLYGAGRVRYVRNITDVDDKINDRAARDFPGLPLNEAIRKVTEETERQFHADVDALGCLRPTVEPRATEHIGEMRAIIEKLVAGGFAYVAENHVLFSPQAMNAANSALPRYGALANRSLDEMIAGARVDVAPYKRDATDFVLWKPSKPGEPSWPSPAGIQVQGRPGWHIECSAMAWKHLGEQFDIHGGGIDLVFPHHENELAQSCCAFHENRMAGFWMHNGFLQVEGEKMSKSLGNFVTIRELLADWPGDVLRLTMLKAHYRQPIDWRKEELQRSQFELRAWADSIFNMALEPYFEDPDLSLLDNALVEALCDDLNTPLAITKLHDLFDQAKKDRSKGPAFAANARFVGFSNLNRPGYFTTVIPGYVPPGRERVFDESFGLMMNFRNYTANGFSSIASSSSADLKERGILVGIGRRGEVVYEFAGQVESFENRIQRLISERNAARLRKDFTESDRIRVELGSMGVVLKDGKDANGNPITTWEVAR